MKKVKGMREDEVARALGCRIEYVHYLEYEGRLLYEEAPDGEHVYFEEDVWKVNKRRPYLRRR